MMYIIRQRKVLKGEKGCNIFNIKPTPTTPHPQKKIYMFGVTQPSLLKSTDPKLFFARICKKL